MGKEDFAQNLTGNYYSEPGAVDVTLDFITPFVAGLGLIGKGIKTANIAKNAKLVEELNKKSKVWGKAYKSASGNAEKAIKLLKQKRQGFVPNADNQGTDFVWGEYTPPTKPNEKGGGYGLSHIEGRRNEQGYNGTEFLDEIPYLLKNGSKYNKDKHNGRFYIGDSEKEAVIRTDYNGEPWQWLNSVYFKDK
jgi:hypothetical protein